MYNVFVSDGVYNSQVKDFVQSFVERESAADHAYEMSKATGLITYVYEQSTLVELFSGPCGSDLSDEVADENIEDDDWF